MIQESGDVSTGHVSAFLGTRTSFALDIGATPLGRRMDLHFMTRNVLANICNKPSAFHVQKVLLTILRAVQKIGINKTPVK